MKNKKFKLIILTIALLIGVMSAFGFIKPKPLYALNNIYMNEISDYSTWKHIQMKTRHQSDNYFYHTLTKDDMEIYNNKRGFIGDFENYANDLIGQNYIDGYHQFELSTYDFIIKFTVENVEYVVSDMFLEIETDNDGELYDSASINSLYVVFKTNNYPVKYYYFDNGFSQLDTNGIELQLINYGEINDKSYDDGYEDGRADYGQYFPSGSPNGMYGWYGFQDGYDYGLDIGFNDGIIAGENFNFASLLSQIFVGMGSLLAINLLPGISIGAIISVPIVFGIIAFIIGKRGGKDD